MPIYSYLCQEGHEFDRFLKLEDYKSLQTCDCGAKCKKLIKPTMINFDIPPWESYISPSSGKVITSYAERKRDMKETGCVDYEPSLLKHRDIAVKKEEDKLEKAMDATVEEFFEKSDSRTRERLANELQSGADIEYKRV